MLQKPCIIMREMGGQGLGEILCHLSLANCLVNAVSPVCPVTCVTLVLGLGAPGGFCYQHL